MPTICPQLYERPSILRYKHECQLTLICLIAAVGEIVGTAANQTQLAGETGRAARLSLHFLANVCVPDGEAVARLLWGAAGMASSAVRHKEDQARTREQHNRVPHGVTSGFSVESRASYTPRSLYKPTKECVGT